MGLESFGRRDRAAYGRRGGRARGRGARRGPGDCLAGRGGTEEKLLNTIMIGYCSILPLLSSSASLGPRACLRRRHVLQVPGRTDGRADAKPVRGY